MPIIFYVSGKTSIYTRRERNYFEIPDYTIRFIAVINLHTSMFVRISALLLLLFSVAGNASSQSVYDIRYNFHQPGDSINYFAFFLENGDGTGLMRIRYQDAKGQDMMVEVNMEERYLYESTPKTATNRVLYRPVRQLLIDGNSNSVFLAPSLLFVNNPSSGYLEPAGILSGSAKDSTLSPSTAFSAELKESSSLTREFFMNYFREEDEVFRQFFMPRTRGLTPFEKSTKLIIRIVANINDKDIGSSCKEDMKRFMDMFVNLKNFLGIQLDTLTIFGNKYNRKNTDAAINALKPGPNDIVVFYYTGHGYRIKNDKHKYPFIDLRQRIEQNYKTEALNMEDVFARIMKKGARMNLVMSDCCNSDVEVVNAKGSKPGKQKGTGPVYYEDNIRQLFLNKTRMSLLVSATDNGEKAASNDEFGGFFTFFFKNSLETHCSIVKKDVSWDQVLAEANRLTDYKARHTYCDEPEIPSNICNQHVIYKMVFAQ